ncbi:hypothetical protein GCM10023196_046780 [Actinoallomurus vinaceus]|uniref:Uncharacterized protein n=1 Tax=Actinoallomurus vinaceus TaxID=1080074 RepID=A0ABP8UDY6_9ACTN
MSFLGAAKVAYYEAMGAAIVIPTAWPVVAIIYLAESDPQALWSAAQGCFDTADEIDKAHREAQQLIDGLSAESWTGDDRDAFQSRMTDYMDQLNFHEDRPRPRTGDRARLRPHDQRHPPVRRAETAGRGARR